MKHVKGDAVIKIELMGKKNRYEGCVLELENDGVVNIVCNNAEQKQDLIELITGTRVQQGICVLGDFDSTHQLSEYKKKVDVVDVEKVDSTLSVKNYLIFYTMVTSVYRDNTIAQFTQLLRRMEMDALLSKPINDLEKAEKIKVRCLAAYLKNIDCLVGKDLMEDLEQRQKENIISFLREYFSKNHCLCLLFENSRLQEEDIDSVYIL